MKKLKHKLTMYFILLSLGIIFLIGVLGNVFIKHNFNQYVKDSLNGRKNDVVRSINSAVRQGKWDLRDIESIGMNALENGLIIRVTDSFDKVVWDARNHNNGMCEAMLSEMSNNMQNIYPGFKGEYTEDTHILQYDGARKGTLHIGYYGPYYYSNSDMIFFKTLNSILSVVGAIALIFSIFIGIILSNSIGRPILRIIDSTNLIANGNYNDKISEESSIIEVQKMTDSINKLATDLENQDEMRKRLTKDISHELRTPLTTIQGQIEAIIDGIWEPTEERLRSINEETKRLSRLVGDLEKLSRVEGENLGLNITTFDVAPLLASIIVNFEKQLIDKEITCETNLSNCTISADRDKISQAIINIMSNAIKYTPRGKKIRVYCDETPERAIISIRDTGIGIAEEHLPYIFDRFYRVDESRARSSGGSGVGLTIAKTIVKRHGGDIKVLSVLNEGTEFVIELSAAWGCREVCQGTEK